MFINRALIDRALDIPPINDNAVMVYRRLISLIEEYNRIARNKGLPTKKIPGYVDNMNHALIRQLTVSILKDIDRVKRIKAEDEEEEEDIEQYKNTADVEFTIGTITELPTLAAWKEDGSLWYYIQDGDDICVYADAEAMKAR